MTDYGILAQELLLKLCDNARLRYQRDLGDFSHGELSILDYLCSIENGICPGVLCDTLGMTTPRISAAISSLQKKGLVTRETDPDDRRKIHIFISDEGKTLVTEKREELREHIAKVLVSLGENDAREYVRIMGRINENAPL